MISLLFPFVSASNFQFEYLVGIEGDVSGGGRQPRVPQGEVQEEGWLDRGWRDPGWEARGVPGRAAEDEGDARPALSRWWLQTLGRRRHPLGCHGNHWINGGSSIRPRLERPCCSWPRLSNRISKFEFHSRPQSITHSFFPSLSHLLSLSQSQTSSHNTTLKFNVPINRYNTLINSNNTSGFILRVLLCY